MYINFPELCPLERGLQLQIVAPDSICLDLYQYLPKGFFSSNHLFSGRIVTIQIAETQNADQLNFHGDGVSLHTFPHEKYQCHLIPNGRILIHQSRQHSFTVKYANATETIPETIVLHLAKHTLDLAPSFVMRIYRDILQSFALLSGYLMVHGCLIDYHNTIYAITGPKGSGKTFSLLEFLSRGATYLANDRFLMHPKTKKAIGYPIVALVSRKEKNNLPQILRQSVESNSYYRANRDNISSEKAALTPLELTIAFNVSYKLDGSIGKIFLLKSRLETSIQTNIDDVFYFEDSTFKPFIFCQRPHSVIFDKEIVTSIKYESVTNDEIFKMLF